ncbi:hypothetical protein OCC_10249 [Thermococcus litoralis DSM 5473]|uniref:Uncharacterized protein n=1 Tax=Thermococcus litoralis (strain ATCC 51850 / DSM 5473 / JCM 8560 / NS-C) TaxID=523849 RepID=H3ZJM6_THELN|nr:hypothetical protein [Thermococcus litoralis]EHR79850.1 hypothetical protein OCC_10249 [Thermococcus litoralis DSM 5473]
MWGKLLGLILGLLVSGAIGGTVRAAEPETKADDSSSYYWNGHFIGKVGVASTYLPKVIVINQDDIATPQQTFVLRVKLGEGWKSGWNHYYYPVSSRHWLSVEVIKPSTSTHVGIQNGPNGIFVIDSGSSESKTELAYREFFKMAMDALAGILGLPNFMDPVFNIGSSERGSYTIQTSGDVAHDVSKITIRFYGDSRFRGTDYGAGVTWHITNPQQADYQFKVSGGATLYVAEYSHNSIPVLPMINRIAPTSVIGETERSADVTTVTEIYYGNKNNN